MKIEKAGVEWEEVGVKQEKVGVEREKQRGIFFKLPVIYIRTSIFII